jgi:hypothetical protein
VQPLKNFAEFYGTRRFNTVFTRALFCCIIVPLSIDMRFTPFGKALLLLYMLLQIAIVTSRSTRCLKNLSVVK